jgi:hypothetical protein
MQGYFSEKEGSGMHNDPKFSKMWALVILIPGKEGSGMPFWVISF